MLFLARHVGEQIVIDDNIRIEVVEVTADKVRFSVRSPASVRVGQKGDASTDSPSSGGAGLTSPIFLTRRQGEQIVINDHIRIKVLEVVTSDYVRLGVQAPANVRVDRLEIYEKRVADAKKARPAKTV